MNSELTCTGLGRIIIPTLYHPQYVDCARALTRTNDPAGFVRSLAKMARWASQFDFWFRNSQLTHIKRLGRTEWKIKTGCSQRSFVECTNHRLKAITGGHLAARTLERQKVEVRLRCKVLNTLATSTWSPTA